MSVACVVKKPQPAVEVASTPARMTDAATRASFERVITTPAYRIRQRSMELGIPYSKTPLW
jgi:hypothetical protein